MRPTSSPPAASKSPSAIAPFALRPFAAYVAGLCTLAIAACSSSTGPAAPSKAGYGASCKVDSDCGTTNGFPLVCGVNHEGQPACVESCSTDYGNSVQGGVGGADSCVNGRITPCEELPPATTCGCGCAAGTYCAVSADGSTGQCVPTLSEGAACGGDAMCTSGLCFACRGTCIGGAFSGTCSVPLGQSCTGPSDCPACFLTNGGQPSWCSLPCSVSANPGGGFATNNCPSGYACLGPTGAQQGDCYEQCNSAVGDGLTGTTGCPAGTTCKPYVTGSPATTGTIDASGYACQ